MSGIDSIRRNARQLAWQYYDGSSRNYNPFARTSKGSFPRGLDEEADVGRRTNDEQAHATHDTDNPSTFVADDKTRAPGDVPTDGAQPVSSETSNEEAAPNGQAVRRRGKFARMLHLGGSDQSSKEGKKSGLRAYKHIPVMQQVKATVFGSWINLLLVCVPVGFAINYAHLNGKANFVVNFIAIIPLAAMLSFATEELAMYTGETLGGLLNATFGNATELIVSIIALKDRKILIVQTSLIGSMLSNLLLVLGMCFFFGGINRVKQHFNITVAQTASSLLALSIGSLIIPTAFVRFGSENGTVNGNSAQSGIAPISRGTAIILLVVYACYLLFQLKTHVSMYNEPSKKVEKRHAGGPEKGDIQLGIARMGAGTAASAGGQVNQANLVKRPEKGEDDEDEAEEPSLSLIGALVTLTISTVLIAFNSDFMVNGIDSISDAVPQEFIGLILIPIVGNAAEHATAVTVAIKDKMDLAIGVAIGSSIQIALLVLPLMVVISWCGLGSPDDLTLGFDGFQVTILFIAGWCDLPTLS